MLEFIIVTPVVYLLYYIFMINKYDDNGKLKEKKRSAFMATLMNRIKLFFFSAKNEKEEIYKALMSYNGRRQQILIDKFNKLKEEYAQQVM
jgi:hypothetical protein